MADEKTVLTNLQVQEILPHRYPFLMIDRVVELDPGKRGVAIKAVTANEWYFPGHVPGYPVMPGVLQVEALAQIAGIVVLSLPENKGVRGLEIRGNVEILLTGGKTIVPTFDPEMIRLKPTHIASWGIDSDPYGKSNSRNV